MHFGAQVPRCTCCALPSSVMRHPRRTGQRGRDTSASALPDSPTGDPLGTQLKKARPEVPPLKERPAAPQTHWPAGPPGTGRAGGWGSRSRRPPAHRPAPGTSSWTASSIRTVSNGAVDLSGDRPIDPPQNIFLVCSKHWGSKQWDSKQCGRAVRWAVGCWASGCWAGAAWASTSNLQQA